MSDEKKIDYNPDKLTEGDRCATIWREFSRYIAVEAGGGEPERVAIQITCDGNGISARVPPAVARDLAFELLSCAATIDGKRDLVSAKELLGLLDSAARQHRESALNLALRVCEDIGNGGPNAATRAEKLMEAANRYAVVAELRALLASAQLERK